MELLTTLLNHPIMLVVILLFVMGFFAMTYEFILKLLGKKSLGSGMTTSTSRWPDDLEDDPPPPPPESAKVPNPPTGPKNTLVEEAEIEGAEEVEDEDGNTTIEYIYQSKDPLDDNYWSSMNWEQRTDEPEMERTH